jgi:NitT/TauT family transport system permease protein
MRDTARTLRDWVLRMVAPLIVGIVILTIWEICCRAWRIPPYLFPAPSAIATALVDNWAELLRGLWSTLQVTFKAFGIAVVVGTLVAFLFVQSRLIEISLFPYAVLLQVTPIVAIAPLIIILVKDTQTALTICATIIALFPIISNTIIGLRSVDPDLLNFFRMNKASRLKTLVRLRIPSALPYFLAGLRISSGLALIGSVVAEFIAGTGGRSAGLAFQILEAGFQLNIPLMFAALLLIAVAGIVLFLLMVGLSKLLLGHWHESAVRREL